MPRKKVTRKEKGQYQWFVEPLEDVAHANKVVSGFLENYDDKIMSLMRDKRAKRHRVWQCSYKEAEQLLASHETVQAKFAIWNRAINSGPIHYVSFIVPLGKKLRAKKAMERTFKIGPRPITENTVTEPPF